MKKGRYSLDRRAEAILESRHYWNKSKSDPVVDCSDNPGWKSLPEACDSTSINCNPGSHQSPIEGMPISDITPPAGFIGSERSSAGRLPSQVVIPVELPQGQEEDQDLVSILRDICTDPPGATSSETSFSEGLNSSQRGNKAPCDINQVPLSLDAILESPSGSGHKVPSPLASQGQYWIHPDVVKRRDNAQEILPDVKPKIIPDRMTPDMVSSVNPFSSSSQPLQLQEPMLKPYIKQEPGVTMATIGNHSTSCMFGIQSNPSGYHPPQVHSHSSPDLFSPNLYSQNSTHLQPTMPCASEGRFPLQAPYPNISTSDMGKQRGADMLGAEGGGLLSGTDVAESNQPSVSNSQIPGDAM